jgi:glutamate 5-kinase
MPDRAVRQEVLAAAKRIVVKIGTNAICGPTGRPDAEQVADLARQVAALRERGVAVIVVASGAIGAGMGELDLSERPKTMPRLQAAAAVGQGQLMRTFHDAFARHGLRAAQVLLTRDDFEDRARYLNIRNTLRALDDYGAVALINENDTIAVDEIRFGDNDILAALVANVTAADALVLLTTVDGVIERGRPLDVIEEVDEGAFALDSGDRSRHGSGGMATKLEAARLVTRAGQAAVIANARSGDVLLRLVSGERVGTVIVPASRRMSGRKRWIGHAARAAGKLFIDDGAARAITERGKSLLPSGVTAVAGSFGKGATVAVVARDGRELARGLTNYSSEQIDIIKGLKSSQIAKALGDKPYDEVVHRDYMTLA